MEFSFNKENIVYVIDTSGLIKLESTFKYNSPVFKAIWEEIEELIQSGSFKTLDWVESEINSYKGKEDFLKKWLKKWRKLLIVPSNEEIINTAAPIINEEYETGFFDAKKLAEGVEEADPYLIAFCKINHFVLITDESKTKHNRIPAVAEKNGVDCIDIYKFLEKRELKMIRKNS